MLVLLVSESWTREYLRPKSFPSFFDPFFFFSLIVLDLLDSFVHRILLLLR